MNVRSLSHAEPQVRMHFAKFWMHARFLMVEGEKMSKSKGNFWTVRDVLEGRATGVKVHPAVSTPGTDQVTLPIQHELHQKGTAGFGQRCETFDRVSEEAGIGGR